MEQLFEFIGNHPIMSGIWIVLFFALIYSFLQSKLSPFGRVNPTQLTTLVNRENGLIVDIRAQDDFRKGHIANAKQINLSQIQSKNFAGLEKSKDQPIIVVCTAGMTAAKAATTLAQNEFTNVQVLEGGMNAWTGANLPTVKG